jgi:hypothetical protein
MKVLPSHAQQQYGTHDVLGDEEASPLTTIENGLVHCPLLDLILLSSSFHNLSISQAAALIYHLAS